MSKILRKVKHFLTLLLTTSDEQKRALLESVTDEQIHAITEIIHNLLHVVDITPEARKDLKKRMHVLSKLSKKKASVRSKRNLLFTHARLVLKTLKLIQGPLLALIKA